MTRTNQDVLNMTEAAIAVGLSYDHFRKIWRQLVAERGFPPPFVGKLWDRQAVLDWIRRQSEPPPPKPPAGGQRGPRPPRRALTEHEKIMAEVRRIHAYKTPPS